MFSCEYFKNFKNTYFEGRTFANGCFRLLLKVVYFAIYCTYSALIHFTIHVHLCRRWASVYTFLLAIAPWQEISKTIMKWELTFSDRNNDYFYINWLKEVFLTGFKKDSDIDLQYTLLCEIFRKVFCEVLNISQNTVSRCYISKSR